MNSKFYELPKKKQDAIINAAFRVFSESSYKKAPMTEIALEAGISKSLLFHYFTNKKELYLYLYEELFKLMLTAAEEEKLFEETDFFEFFIKGANCKLKVLRNHEDIYRFAIKAYLEKDPIVVDDIKRINQKGYDLLEQHFNRMGQQSKLKEGVVVNQLVKIIWWCIEGMFLEKAKDSLFNMKQFEREFLTTINFYRQHFSKGEK